jgi:uncharacterized membrane protein YjgN (DUF898 family)
MSLEANISMEEGMDSDNTVNKENFQFTGSGAEFFKIWIVNLFLSIITLGIYSAWAKVRTNRYFYGNTQLAGNNFEYHAEPLQILKGRIIAVVFLLCYSFSAEIHPFLGFAFAIALFVLTPWVIVNAIKFNARMSSYRGIHFNFHGTYGDAISSFILWPVFSVFTLGLLLPYAFYKQAKFFLQEHTYGKTPFDFAATAGKYYQAILICLLVLVGLFAVVALLANGISFTGLFSADPKQLPDPTNIFVLMATLYFPFIIASLIYRGLAYNIAFDHLSIKSNQFNSRLNVTKWSWIVLSNMVLILCTLGLFYPWARVRAAKYKALVTEVELVDLNSFVASQQQQKSALGDEIGEAFDIGVSI